MARADRGDGHVAAQVDAVVGVEVSEHPGQLGAEDGEQRQLGVFEQGDLRACRAGRGGGLQPDPARADDHYRVPDWSAALRWSLSSRLRR